MSLLREFKITDEQVTARVLFRKISSLSMVILSGWLLMYSIFPLYEPVLPITRDYSTAAQGLLFVLLAIAAMRRPRLLNIESLSIIALALVVGGVALAYLGVSQNSPILMVTSSTFMRMTMSWFQIVVGISLVKLNPRQLSACISIAFLLSFCIQGCIFLLPQWVGVAAFAAIPFGCYLLAIPMARPTFEHLKTAESPFESSITRPSSFLPFSHQLFICFLVFSVIRGFVISFGEIEGTPLTMLFSPITFLFLAIAIIFCKWEVRANRLFDISVLLIVAGLLLVPLIVAMNIHPVTNLLISSGADCFYFLF
jgi:hypothetical protein